MKYIATDEGVVGFIPDEINNSVGPGYVSGQRVCLETGDILIEQELEDDLYDNYDEALEDSMLMQRGN